MPLTLAAATVDWLTVLLSLGGAGGIVAIFRLRPQNALDTANRAKILDEIQTNVLLDFRKEYQALAAKLDNTVVELAHERAASARKDVKIQILERRLEQLMDELAALRAQLGLGGRREDDDPHA